MPLSFGVLPLAGHIFGNIRGLLNQRQERGDASIKKKNHTKNNITTLTNLNALSFGSIGIQCFIFGTPFIVIVFEIIGCYRLVHGIEDSGVIMPQSLVNIIRCGGGEVR